MMAGQLENSTAAAGAPPGNRNAMTHGMRSFLTTGSLPKGASYVRRIAGEFRRAMEAAVLDVNGSLGPLESALIQSATRHEIRALLATRWLRQGGEGLPLSDRLALLKTIGDASDQRDRCLKPLGLLGVDKPDADPWSDWSTPPTPRPQEGPADRAPVANITLQEANDGPKPASEEKEKGLSGNADAHHTTRDRQAPLAAGSQGPGQAIDQAETSKAHR